MITATVEKRWIKILSFSCLIFISTAFSSTASAESGRPTASSANEWIARLGSVAFSTAGGVFLPSAVLQGLRQGQVSPIMQFVMANNTMNKCIQDVVKYAPDRKDPFVVATAKFTNGICRIKKCFQSQMLLLLLPALSSNPNYGGSTNAQSQKGNAALGATLAQAFQKDELCDKSGQGIDPMLIGLFTAAR